MKQFSRALVIGIDGLDPRILGDLRAQGAVPNFDRLWTQGAGGALQTVTPSQSPVVWTSMATGSNPGKHGVFDFIQRDPKRPLPYLSISRQSKGLGGTRYVRARRNRSFWEVLTDRGVPATVVRWPVTFPAEEVSGRMLSGLGTVDVRGMLGSYTFYTTVPAQTPDVPKERLVEVQPQDGVIRTAVGGPLGGLTGRSRSEAPLTIRLTDGGATVEAGDSRVTLSPGRWSEWVRLRFSVGPLKSVSAVAKFYLVEREPAFKLYVTAPELDPAEPAFKLSHPDGYAAELAQAIGTYYTLGIPEDNQAWDQGAVGGDAFLEQCEEITEQRLKMFRYEFERFKEGLLAFVFDTSDRIQHMFWRENEVQDRTRVTRLGPTIRDHYVAMDRLLGEVLPALDDRTALVLVSDHGFASYDTSFDLNAWLAREGFMALNGDPAGVPDEENGLWRLVDWSKTVAYGCGFSSVYLNLKGREGNGIVERSEADSLAARLAERLLACTDQSTGLKPIARADRRSAIYSGGALDGAPDIVIGTLPGYRMGWQTPVGGVAADVLSPNEKHWAGDHIVDPAAVPGTVMSNVPLDVQGASVLDVAPTVLALLGVKPDPDWDGRVLPLGRS